MTSSTFNFDNWIGDIDTLAAEIEEPWLRGRVGADWDEVDGFDLYLLTSFAVPAGGQSIILLWSTPVPIPGRF